MATWICNILTVTNGQSSIDDLKAFHKVFKGDNENFISKKPYPLYDELEGIVLPVKKIPEDKVQDLIKAKEQQNLGQLEDIHLLIPKNILKDLLIKYKSENWYDNKTMNRNNPYQDHINSTDTNDNLLRYTFDTKGEPPIEAIKNLSKNFLGLEFELEFVDEFDLCCNKPCDWNRVSISGGEIYPI